MQPVLDAQLTVEMTPPQQQGGMPAFIAEGAAWVPDDYDSETSNGQDRPFNLRTNCLIDPLNLWKAVPPVSKYIDIHAKHDTDSDTYNSAIESESSLSSGFVSEHDDGIPDDQVDWVKTIFPVTTKALKRAKIGTFVKQKPFKATPAR
jgi:hypothetical protein